MKISKINYQNQINMQDLSEKFDTFIQYVSIGNINNKSKNYSSFAYIRYDDKSTPRAKELIAFADGHNIKESTEKLLKAIKENNFFQRIMD